MKEERSDSYVVLAVRGELRAKENNIGDSPVEIN